MYLHIIRTIFSKIKKDHKTSRNALILPFFKWEWGGGFYAEANIENSLVV